MLKLRSIYHFCLAFLGALIYRFPSRRLYVVGVTGTKGKTSTVELLNAILERAGFRTALSSTLRFKIDQESQSNRRKMTMPGRFFLQRFLHQALKAGCHYVVLEMTSAGVLQSRHRFIYLDALVFTNLAPEHIEQHGSFENYVNAKLEIAKSLEQSPKPNKVIVANGEDEQAHRFLAVHVPHKVSFSLDQIEPIRAARNGTEFTLDGETITTQLPGRFNLYNILAAASFAKTQGIKARIIKQAVEGLAGIRGRMEPIGRQEFDVIVDYAHTPDSLLAVYETFHGRRKICVLGGTGGGRDRWKRKTMGKIAANHCDKIILTDEDPYNEDPMQIINDVASGVTDKDKYEIILDRREAIRAAIKSARPGWVVLITGKGTDPYIMGARGSKIPWSDAEVAREELERARVT